MSISNIQVIATYWSELDWRISTGLPILAAWSTVTYGNGLFVALNNGTPSFPTSLTAATSPDGITWTSRTVPGLSTLGWTNSTFGNNTFLAITGGTVSGGVAATSPNGITWTQRSLGDSREWSGVAYGNGTFLAVSRNGVRASTSATGASWALNDNQPSTTLNSLAFGNGKFVSISTAGTAYSTLDGINWSNSGTMPVVTSPNWSDLTYGGGLFIACNTNSSEIATSPNGSTWTLRNLPSPAIRAAASTGIYATINPGFFSTQDNATTNISKTGTTWTKGSIPSASWTDIVAGADRFVAVARGNQDNWSQTTMSAVLFYPAV